MVDFSSLIDEAIKLSDKAAALLPGIQQAGDAVEIGKKIIDLVDSLNDKADVTQQDKMQRSRAALAEAVKAKAARTSDRLRGD